MSVALIDADIIVYKASAVSESNIDWGDGGEGKTLNEGAAIRTAIKMVHDWTKAAKSKKTILAFSDRRTERASFRYDVLPSYHANRKDEKPELHDIVAAALKKEFTSAWLPHLEGDDVLGIMATSGELDNPVIVSTDKDMVTIPARVVNPERSKVIQKISPLVADRNWMTQTLTGDTTDGYKGCPLIGPVKAKQILALSRDLTEMWAAVFQAYLDAKVNRSKIASFVLKEAVQQARVARILRASDYNKDTGEIKLWHPRNPEWIHPSNFPR